MRERHEIKEIRSRWDADRHRIGATGIRYAYIGNVATATGPDVVSTNADTRTGGAGGW